MITADSATPPRTVGRRFPVEWAIVAIFLVATAVPILQGKFRLNARDVLIYSPLVSAFTAGVLLCIALSWIERLRQLAIPQTAIPGKWRATLALASAGLAGAFLLVRFAIGLPPLERLLVAGTVGALTLAGMLTLFVAAAGLVPWPALARTALDFLQRWGPWYAALLATGFWLSLLRPLTPMVWDPVLLRMDYSLGFRPSEVIFAWAVPRHWVELISIGGYPLLGFMLAGVAARLFAARAHAHARRCLAAFLFASVLAPLCYWLFPAIGPIHAFRELFAYPSSPFTEHLADLTRQAALTGASQISGDQLIVRNVMPSLHTAFALLALTAAWSWRRRFFWAVLPLGVVQIATTMTLCVHYLADLFAAVPFAALCWWLADRAVRTTGTRDTDLPPLAAAQPRRANLSFFAALGLAGGALATWAHFAPIPPTLAWVLALLIVVPPTWAALRANATMRPTVALVVKTERLDPRVRLLRIGVFCSGGIALVLEQIYEKYLSTLVGSSRTSATIVLAVYFVGLALGAWLCPKRSAGAPRRLAFYELFIAAWAGLVGLAFFACDRTLGGWLAATGTSTTLLNGMRIGLAALWILPPTLAMGAQLPTLATVLAGHPLWQRERLTRYYAINLWGAFAFTFAAPPLLFNLLGADGTLRVLAILGAGVALLYWFALPVATSTPPAASIAHATLRVPLPHFRTALGLAFGAGFLFFALEVIWFHLISAVCGASTYSFSSLLAIVLLGLAIAGRNVHRSRTIGLGAVVTVLAGLLVVLALSNAAWPWAGRLMLHLQNRFVFHWFWAGELLKFGVVALLVLPPAILLGHLFPLVLRQFEDSPRVGAATGWLCAFNVVGCVAGALLTGFAFIPAWGSERTLLALALAVALGAATIAVTTSRRHRHLFAIGAGAALLVFLPRWNRLELTRGFGVYLTPQVPPNARLTFWREDFESGFITVTSTPSLERVAPVKTLWQNGKFDADDANEMPAQIGFGLVAGLHAPAQNHALVIGCGSGQTASIIARLGFRHVDLVELSPAHLAAARTEFAPINVHLLDRPNVSVHVEDGRNFLLRSRQRYDAIQIELTSVWFAGATNLYSREFYALARAHLSPGGVLAQWIQLHHLTPRELASVFATARAVFPFVSLWRAGHQACLLASVVPQDLNPTIWRKWRWSPELFDERVITGLGTPEQFAATELTTPRQLDALLAHMSPVINTDANRWLEFQTPKYYLNRTDLPAKNLAWLEQR